MLDLNKTIQVKRCIYLIKKYNSNTSSDNKFDIDRCKESLINMSLGEIKQTMKEVNDLLQNQQELAALDKIIGEVKIYGAEYVKRKYLING